MLLHSTFGDSASVLIGSHGASRRYTPACSCRSDASSGVTVAGALAAAADGHICSYTAESDGLGAPVAPPPSGLAEGEGERRRRRSHGEATLIAMGQMAEDFSLRFNEADVPATDAGGPLAVRRSEP